MGRLRSISLCRSEQHYHHVSRLAHHTSCRPPDLGIQPVSQIPKFSQFHCLIKTNHFSTQARVMQSKSEKDCPFCVAQKAAGNQRGKSCTHLPFPWDQRKGRGGRKKRISTQGYACPNPSCDYYRIVDEKIHALIGYGGHGKGEAIQDFFYKC